MSLSEASAPALRPRLTRTALRVLAALAALVIVAAGLAVIVSLFGFGAPKAAVAPKNPFGTGLREAGPAATGIGGAILLIQSQFNRAMMASLEALKADGTAVWSLIGVGFVYGVFHAAGPGHGKGVISAYLMASRRTLTKGLGLSLAAALLQALVAIALVVVLAVALRATAAKIDAAAGTVELASFAAIALFGAVLLWRKTAHLVPSPVADHRRAHDHHDRHGHAHGHRHDAPAHDHVHDDDCGHAHIPPPAALDRMMHWREIAGVVVAAGIRPCSGAILLLVFALSQGLLAAGITATFAMALGTAVTTGALAALAVLAKSLAVRLAGHHGEHGGRAVAALEVLAAAFVLVLGVALLIGIAAPGTGAS